MNKNRIITVVAGYLIAVAVFVYFLTEHAPVKVQETPAPNPFELKISAAEALQKLKTGNEQFANGEMTHPHLDSERLIQAGQENQADHAYATIITCSDSRVPLEAVFDAGIMDIFVIRVAGNVCDTDEIGSIEYGLAHVHTPVLVVLGHTQCGAVTAVTNGLLGHGHKLEINIPPLVDNIEPAVRRVMDQNPDVTGKDLIPLAITENVWQGIEDLFMKSPVTRRLVDEGYVKVVGAVYDVGSGKVNWLEETRVSNLLKSVEERPDKDVNEFFIPADQDEASDH